MSLHSSMPAFGVPDLADLSGSATAIVHMPWPLEREGTGRAVAAAAEGDSTPKGFASVIRNTSTLQKRDGPGSSSDAVQTRFHPPSELDRAFSTYAPARQTVPYHLPPPPPPPHSHRLPPPPLPAPPQAVFSHQQVFVANISSHPHSTPSSSSSFATEQVMYANLQLQQLSTPPFIADEMLAHSAYTSPAPMYSYQQATYQQVPMQQQSEYMVDPTLYYQQDHGHVQQLHPIPFAAVDYSGRSVSPLSADATSSNSQSPYGSPQWNAMPTMQQPVEQYYLPASTIDYSVAGPSSYPVYEMPRTAELTIDTSFNMSYNTNQNYYTHTSSASSACSGSPISYHAPSPPMTLISPVSDASSESRAPASGPARAGRRKAGSPSAPKKVHKCTLCNKSMSRNYDLHRHLQSVHGIGERADGAGAEVRKAGWGCQACGKCFSRKDSMQRHQRDDGCRVLSASATSSDREDSLRL